MESLRSLEANVHAKSERLENAVILATTHNFLRCVELLVTYRVALDEQTKDLQSALTIALKLEYFDLCLYLLARHCDINMRGVNGDTALIRTAFDGRTATAAFILEQGADPSIRNMNGETALMVASRHGQLGVMRLLL
ncbi:ankyrin repeat-containing domain protein, partial [Ochromonadaceae sp. CCMP2298]